MLLTKKSGAAAGAPVSSSFVHRLRHGLSQAVPTMDRRAFLRRSGLGVGAGLAATQLTLVKKADAAGAALPRVRPRVHRPPRGLRPPRGRAGGLGLPGAPE